MSKCLYRWKPGVYYSALGRCDHPAMKGQELYEIVDGVMPLNTTKKEIEEIIKLELVKRFRGNTNIEVAKLMVNEVYDFPEFIAETNGTLPLWNLYHYCQDCNKCHPYNRWDIYYPTPGEEERIYSNNIFTRLSGRL